jgi:hypothetical protein
MMPDSKLTAAEKLKASELEKDLEIGHEHWRDQRKKRKLQKRELGKISNFFIGANLAIALVIVALALIEHFHPTPTKVITDKVIIAAIGGITIQAGAIILAAFKGLFSGK